MPLNNIIAHHEGVAAIRRGDIPLPKFADLHTSNRCNHKCVGCAYRDHLTTDVMSEEDHVKVVHQLLDIGVKAFDFSGGGEPLLLPYITTLFAIIRGHQAHYGLITNGSLLNDDIARKLADQATYVRVSLEASNQAHYEKYKHVGSTEWFKVIENIKRLVSIRNRTSSQCEIAIKFAVGKSLRGAAHYEDGIRLGLDLGVDNVQFKALRHEPEELPVVNRLVQESYIKYVLRDFGDRISSDYVRHWIAPWPEPMVPQCILNPLHTVVDYKGNVYLCCYYYYRPEAHFIGNMLAREFSSFWATPEHAGKILNIDPRECMKVDCKFFRHHRIAEKELVRGKAYWL